MVRAGLCSLCLRRVRLSREKFAGKRELALRADGEACVLCGNFDDLIVHHRNRRLLATLCRGHHARVHHLRRLAYGLDPLFVRLWRERHRGQPEQLELALVAVSPRPVQVALFAAA